MRAGGCSPGLYATPTATLHRSSGLRRPIYRLETTVCQLSGNPSRQHEGQHEWPRPDSADALPIAPKHVVKHAGVPTHGGAPGRMARIAVLPLLKAVANGAIEFAPGDVSEGIQALVLSSFSEGLSRWLDDPDEMLESWRQALRPANEQFLPTRRPESTNCQGRGWLWFSGYSIAPVEASVVRKLRMASRPSHHETWGR